MKQTFLAGLLLVVPLMLLGWLYEGCRTTTCGLSSAASAG